MSRPLSNLFKRSQHCRDVYCTDPWTPCITFGYPVRNSLRYMRNTLGSREEPKVLHHKFFSSLCRLLRILDNCPKPQHSGMWDRVLRGQTSEKNGLTFTAIVVIKTNICIHVTKFRCRCASMQHRAVAEWVRSSQQLVSNEALDRVAPFKPI